MLLEALAIIIFPIIWITLKIFVYQLAKKRILFLTVQEGTAVAIMVGEKFDRFIMNMKGYHLDEYYNVVATKEEKERLIKEAEADKIRKEKGMKREEGGQKKEVKKTLLEKVVSLFSFSGIYWLGLPGVASVYRYPFTWTKLDGLTGKPNSRTELVEQIYVKAYQYLFDLQKAETFSMAPVSIPLLATINVVNLYTALFKNDKWLDLVSSAVLDEARKFVASLYDPNQVMQIAKGVNLEDEELIKKLPTRKKEGSEETITSLGDILLYYLKKDGTFERIKTKVGANISVINVPSVDLGDWADLALAEIKAKKEGDALVATAQAVAKALGIRTTAEVESYGKVIAALGPEFYIALKKIENVTAASKAGTTVLYDTGGIKDFLTRSAESKGVDSGVALDTFARLMRGKNLELPAEFEEVK